MPNSKIHEKTKSKTIKSGIFSKRKKGGFHLRQFNDNSGDENDGGDKDILLSIDQVDIDDEEGGLNVTFDDNNAERNEENSTKGFILLWTLVDVIA
jgi:hypothetical protein